MIREWTAALKLGAWCAWGSVALIPVQIVAGAFFVPPATTREAFQHFDVHPLVGLVSLDLVYLLNNVLILPMYLALTVALWERNRGLVANAFVFAAVGMAALFATNRSVEMLQLWQLQQVHEGLEPIGAAMLATWKGTGFTVYYVLNAIALLIYAVAMRNSAVFDRSTANWGLASGILMAIPSTFGMVGLLFSLASLIPWAVFGVRVGSRLFAAAADR